MGPCGGVQLHQRYAPGGCLPFRALAPTLLAAGQSQHVIKRTLQQSHAMAQPFYHQQVAEGRTLKILAKKIYYTTIKQMFLGMTAEMSL